MRLPIVLIVAATLLAACHSSQPPRAPTPSPAPGTAAAGEPPRPLVGIFTRGGDRHGVHVELAVTESEQRKGLMHRRELGADTGMLFVFAEDRTHTFWMHDTLIALDMLFVRADGTIAGIVESAAPQTDTPRKVGEPTRYVLEVNGGWCAAHGVGVGDRIDLDEALRAVRGKAD